MLHPAHLSIRPCPALPGASSFKGGQLEAGGLQITHIQRRDPTRMIRMSIDHGRLQRIMAHKFLHRGGVIASAEAMCAISVPQGVWCHTLEDAGGLDGLLEGLFCPLARAMR